MTATLEGTRIETATKQGWSESWDTYDNEHTWAVLDALLGVAQESGKTPAQVALQWLLQRPGVTSPIIGARNLKQLEDDLGAIG
jgi:aryl-alcohol dehydrogenase-like predicted oxidoreductase